MKKVFLLLCFLFVVLSILVCKSFFISPTRQNRIGGDKDPHGCLIGAGYSWCEAKQKCLRVWEEGCGKTATKAIRDNVPKSQQECENKKGRWGRIGLFPQETCNLPTSDEGKTCNNPSDCEGSCVATLSKEDQDKAMKQKVSIETSGKCTPWLTTVGCIAQVQEGKVNGMLCID
jgi:hypothetical protein